jgi:carboxypeptidase Taq
LIRTESDEATYNLHIIIRFELEQALLGDDLPVADLPNAWREKYQTYLGIEPPDDADGVLQDVHWSAGLFGYFPTYSLGNLYAAQFFEQAEKDLGGLDEQFARGNFEGLRKWLNTNVHEQGQCYSAAELAENLTGRPLSHKPLIEYLHNKLGPLYGI